MLPSDFHQCRSMCEHPPIDFDLAQPSFISTCGLTYSTVPSRCSSVTLPKLLSYTHGNMQIHTKEKRKMMVRNWTTPDSSIVERMRGDEGGAATGECKKKPLTWGGGGGFRGITF